MSSLSLRGVSAVKRRSVAYDGDVRIIRSIVALVLIGAAGFYLAALVSAVLHHNPAPTDPVSIHQLTPRSPRASIGFSLGVHSVHDITIYTEGIDRIAELGCDGLQILTPIYQRHGGSAEHVRDHRCPTDAQLQTIIQHAHARGLTVHLMPIVLLAEPRGNEWRGKIQPDNWNDWWTSYTRQITRLADLAERNNIAMFSVGSELLSTESQTTRWRQLIAEVRSRYTGSLLYSTNWDHYHVPAFWDRLDRIGINGYWQIAASPDATDAQLAERWAEIRRKVLAYSEQEDRRVIFTEIGYPALPLGAERPVELRGGCRCPGRPGCAAAGVCRVPGRLAGPAADRADGPIEGVFFYEWDVHQRGAAYDRSYGIRGKPAYDVLSDWLKE